MSDTPAVGDVVRLRCGGPWMVITEIAADSVPSGWVRCAWINSVQGRAEGGAFPLAAVVFQPELTEEAEAAGMHRPGGVNWRLHT